MRRRLPSRRRNDQLIPASLFDRFHKSRVLPCVDFAGSVYGRSIGEGLCDDGEDWAVRSIRGAGGNDGGKLECLGQLHQGRDTGQIIRDALIRTPSDSPVWRSTTNRAALSGVKRSAHSVLLHVNWRNWCWAPYAELNLVQLHPQMARSARFQSCPRLPIRPVR